MTAIRQEGCCEVEVGYDKVCAFALTFAKDELSDSLEIVGDGVTTIFGLVKQLGLVPMLDSYTPPPENPATAFLEKVPDVGKILQVRFHITCDHVENVIPPPEG